MLCNMNFQSQFAKVDGQNVKLGNESEDENDQFVKPAVHV